MTWNEWLKRNPDKYIRIVKGKCYIYEPPSYLPTELTNEFDEDPSIVFFKRYKNLQLEIEIDKYSMVPEGTYRFIMSNTFITPNPKILRIVTDHDMEQFGILTFLDAMKDQMVRFLFEG